MKVIYCVQNWVYLMVTCLIVYTTVLLLCFVLDEEFIIQ